MQCRPLRLHGGLFSSPLGKTGGSCYHPSQTRSLPHRGSTWDHRLWREIKSGAEAVGSEISERDSLLQFIHGSVQYDSLRSRSVAHKHMPNFFTLFSAAEASEPASTLSGLHVYGTVGSAGANLIIMYITYCYWVIIADASGQRS